MNQNVKKGLRKTNVLICDKYLIANSSFSERFTSLVAANSASSLNICHYDQAKFK